MDTVQSFVKWCRWFSQMDLILLILSLTPLNLLTNWKSCIVEFRCRKYWSHLEMCPRGGVWRLYWRAKTNPLGHTTLGHNHKLCSCFYNHYFFLNCLSMKGQQARLSERSQVKWIHINILGVTGCVNAWLGRGLRVRKGKKKIQHFYSWLLHFNRLCPSGLSCLISCCSVLTAFFPSVIAFTHDHVGASDRRCDLISPINIVVIFHLCLSRRNLL